MIIRLYQPQPGSAFDRRVITELFMEAAKRFTAVGTDALGDKEFPRNRFSLDTFLEMQTNYEDSIIYDTPKYGHQAPGSDLIVINDDGYFDGELSYSLRVTPEGSHPYRIMAWPTVDGKALWEAESWAEVDQLLTYTPGNTDPENTIANASNMFLVSDEETTQLPISLGNSTVVRGFNARSMTGVLVASIGRFNIVSSQIQLFKRVR